MTLGRKIALAWFTFVVVVATFVFWGITNMGDRPTGMICKRAWWLDPAIFLLGLLVWLLGAVAILRFGKKK